MKIGALASPSRLLAAALAVVAAAFAVARPLAAQARTEQSEGERIGRTPGTAILLGVVRDTAGRPLSGVHVSAVGTRHGVYTNDDGRFMLPPVPAGVQMVRARRIGFSPEIATMVLAAGDTADLVFTLAQVHELAAVVTEGMSRRDRRFAEFERRRRAGFGSFLTRQDLDRIRPSQPSDALRRVAGVRVDIDPKGRKRVVMSRALGLGGACSPLYYVDGVLWTVPGDTDVDHALPSVMEIEAIEVYKGPASVPVALNPTGSACGVVSIWTR